MSTFLLLSAATLLLAHSSKGSSVVSSISNRGYNALISRADEAFCLDPDYSKNTLQPLLETKLGALFADVRGTTSRFEASGVARVPATISSSDDAAALGAGFLVVLDDSTDLAVLGASDLRSSLSPQNRLAKSANDTHHQVESHFEGVVFNPATGTYLIARETIELPQQGGFFPGIWEAKLIVPPDEQSENETSRLLYEVVEECWVNYQMESDNKGFEGLEIIPTRDGQGVLLMGLCEGNHCRDGNAGQEKGNGVIVVSSYTTRRLVDGSGVVCVWEPIAEIPLPPTADFEDYSDLAFAPPLSPGGSARLSVVSQQESAVFLAEFDTETLEFTSNGRVYHFPRNDRCEVKYCNVEGIVWLDPVRFVAVSDKAKDGDPYFCLAGDQSIGIFSLPA